VTERLYYTDPYLTEFTAHVVGVVQIDGRSGVVLDRTAFYPTSGGQPFDTGAIGAARVIDVIDQEDGRIVHVVEGGVPGGGVSGRVDWARRFEHMQQHTGQHVLSAAFDQQSNARTVSFHLGSASATIDLAREVSAAEIASAEDAANRVVWEDRPVAIRFVDAADAAALPLRKESARSGTLRIIDVEGFDVSACGGTHVARTGAIGLIVISGWERFRGGSRIEFRCGVRALHGYRALRETVAAGVKLTSVAAEELPQAIDRLQSESRELRRQAKDLGARLAVFEAEAMAARASDVGGVRVVVEAVPDVDMNGLKTLAQSLTARGGHAAVLFSTSAPASVVIARSADVTLDAAGLLKELTAKFGGKGGGRPELAQGGGLSGTAEEMIAVSAAIIGRALSSSA
jgi:alanyl-tRNA synthetase